MLSENKHNRNEDNIKHMEMKMKKMRQMRQKKIKNTREELDMIKSGLVNLLNCPIINHREIINVKNYRRNLIKMFEVTHHAK